MLHQLPASALALIQLTTLSDEAHKTRDVPHARNAVAWVSLSSSKMEEPLTSCGLWTDDGSD
ncbi:hypothetical protein PsorP6_018088 [Peronosclerospora sorghi]|uniref:Uncharacterized protein n=1 Tax=Peronosclerospora sorghi TaxID=230839 RepID=A0ACC0WCF1_9STRA|nr:hypothetical protein PsorP6_018088 [Peronosclerospora sorghi]